MEETKAYLTVLSCSKLLYTFSYLLNSAEVKADKLYIEMRLADQFCVSSNILPLKLAIFIVIIMVISEKWPGMLVSRRC